MARFGNTFSQTLFCSSVLFFVQPDNPVFIYTSEAHLYASRKTEENGNAKKV